VTGSKSAHLRAGDGSRRLSALRPRGEDRVARRRVRRGQAAVRAPEVEDPVALLHPQGGVRRRDGAAAGEVARPADGQEVLEGGRLWPGMLFYGALATVCWVGYFTLRRRLA